MAKRILSSVLPRNEPDRTEMLFLQIFPLDGFAEKIASLNPSPPPFTKGRGYLPLWKRGIEGDFHRPRVM